jgi:predicted transcriptional regulator
MNEPKLDETILERITDFLAVNDGARLADVHRAIPERSHNSTMYMLRMLEADGRVLAMRKPHETRYFLMTSDSHEEVEILEKEGDVAGTTSKKGHNGNVSIQ